MKNAIVSLCICLSLVVLPCISHAGDYPKLEKMGSVISSGLIGASAGLLTGVVIAGFSSSSSGSPALVGLVAGFGLGVLYALLSPATDDPAQGNAQPSVTPPSPAPAAGPQ